LPNANVDQLRADIDRGRTGDKVAAPDPAAVPLGTDEEAAGTPVPSSAITAARDLELARAQNRPQKSMLGVTWALAGFVVLLAIAVMWWMLWR
jgi:hypothetical protein